MPCVCESTKPGISTPRRQSISRADGNRERKSPSGPTSAMRSPSTATAASVRTCASPSSVPRRARAGPAHVTTCDALAKMSGSFKIPYLVSRVPRRCTSGHHVANTRKSKRRLRFAPAGVVACVAVDRFVLREVAPVEISRKVRATFDAAVRVDVNGPNPGAARLADLATKVTWNLLEIVVGIRDDSAATALQREQFAHDAIGVVQSFASNQKLAVAILGVGVHAEVDAHTERLRRARDREHLIEIVVLDDRVEPNVVD